MLCASSASLRRSVWRLHTLLAAGALLLGGGAFRAEAATLLVSTAGANAGNCQSTACATVTYALTQAAAGDTISVGAGTFVENVAIDKSVILAGAGQASTTFEPASSSPTCGAPEPQPSLCAGSSNVLLVQADNVEIHDLTVDGNNPSLTSGATSGGVDVDARNGIITNHTLGTFNGLNVHDVTVKNIYLRGIYASSGGTFTFTHDTVQNVQAGYYSICMFNFGGSGVMSLNTASGCSDAISSNWSKGVQFRNNVITASDSGVHTDNASGPTADVIDGNQASGMHAGAYGFFVFAPYVAPTVSNNTVTGAAVGLGAFGHGQPGSAVSSIFQSNTVDCQSQAGSVGAWVSTTEFSFGSADVAASLQGNHISNCATGIDVQAEVPAVAAQLGATGNTVLGSSTAGVALDPGSDGVGTYTVSLDHNRIFGNAIGLDNPTGEAVTATENWWGCNAGPGGSGALGPCDTISEATAGSVTFGPWLVLATPVVNPTTFNLSGGSASVSTDVEHDSSAALSAPGVPDQTPVTFTTTLAGGVLTPPTVGTVTGQASTTLTATLPGSGNDCATVDNERLCSAAVTVTGFSAAVPTLGGTALLALAGLLAVAALVLLRRR